MSKIVVTVISSGAVAVAMAATVLWGRLDTHVRVRQENAIGEAVRRLCVLEVSGLVAGVLVAGFGSRLMMRIMAATSNAAAQGRITQAQEVVGRVTRDGTTGLVIFTGLGLGLVGAGLYALVGRFLPKRAWQAGAILGLLALGIFARTDPLDPKNRDFTFLSPVVLAVVLIVALFVLYGATLAAIAARLERAYPPFSGGWRLVAYVPLLLLVVPPLTPGILMALVVGVVNERLPGLRSRMASRIVANTGAAVVALATIAGNVWLAFAVADILA